MVTGGFSRDGGDGKPIAGDGGGGGGGGGGREREILFFLLKRFE